MKVRMVVISLLACLGLIGLVQATGAESSSGAGFPIQEIYLDQGLV